MKIFVLMILAFLLSACGAKNAYNAQKCQEGSAKHCVLYLEKVRADLEKEANKQLKQLEKDCKTKGICQELQK